jgi:hypothetical protein
MQQMGHSLPLWWSGIPAFLTLVELEGKETHGVVNALTRHVRNLPAQLQGVRIAEVLGRLWRE